MAIDTSVLEKLGLAVVLRIDFDWGATQIHGSPWENSPQDAVGNAVDGDAILIDTSSTLIHSDRSLVATIGVDDLSR